MNQLTIITYVLDDDEDELMLLQPLLEKVCGCDLELYTKPEDFIHALATGVHIAIIDHQLNAVIDGIEVGRKALEKNPFIFPILFSGSAVPKVWQRATNSGFRRLIDKNEPDAYEQLATMVAEELPRIRQSIDAFFHLETLNNKYKKYLTHERAT
jgi:CheY-like chemotaxis protein